MRWFIGVLIVAAIGLFLWFISMLVKANSTPTVVSTAPTGTSGFFSLSTGDGTNVGISLASL